MRKVLIIDTSILCVWLEVPGKETCGTDTDKWNQQRVQQEVQKEIQDKTTLILPLATIIETGNHIAQAVSNNKYKIAEELAKVITYAADGETPWAIFEQQFELGNAKEMKKLATTWPVLALQKISIGDATIIKVADYYAKMGNEVIIFTGDKGLKAHQPSTPPKRRRSQS